jgi:GT2 family glycosyltransferase
MALVAVIIINYNSGGRLARAIAALERQTFRDFEVVVFDNASADRSAEISSRSIPIRIVRNASNVGFAAGNNRAAAGLLSEWIAFLNPDAYPDPDWLAELIAATRRHGDVDAFGSTQINAANPGRLDGAGDAYHFFGVPYRGHFGWPVERLPDEGECFAPCAAAALWRRERFEALGGFDESFFCYGEDVDLGFRHRLMGGRAIQAARARVLHEGSGVTGRRSDFTIFHGHRNRIWTWMKNMPAPLFWPAVPFQIVLDLYLLARLGLIGSGSAYARGVAAALKGAPRIWRERVKIQASRKVGAAQLALMLTWSPIKLMRREADVKPVTRT